MSNRPLLLDGFTESLVSFSNYRNEKNEKEDTHHKKMIYSLKKIIVGELTPKQQRCVWLYYGERKKMKDIACEMGIGVSSVSRHLKRARMRIEKTMNYYF